MLIIPHLLTTYYGYDDSKSYGMYYSKDFSKYLKTLTEQGDELAKSLLPNKDAKIKKSYIKEKINFVNIHKTKENNLQVSFLELGKLLTRLSYTLKSTNIISELEKNDAINNSKIQDLIELNNAGYYISTSESVARGFTEEALKLVRVIQCSFYRRGNVSVPSHDLQRVLRQDLNSVSNSIINSIFRYNKYPINKDTYKEVLDCVKNYLQGIINKDSNTIIENGNKLSKLFSTTGSTMLRRSRRAGDIYAQSSDSLTPTREVLMYAFAAVSSCSDRTTTNLGKLASTLFNMRKHKEDKGISANQISNFVEKYTIAYFSENKLNAGEGCFKIVEGDEIPYYYFFKNNDVKRNSESINPHTIQHLNPMDFIIGGDVEREELAPPGKLESSCMRNASHFLDVYAKNPKSIKMLVKFSNNSTNKIVGRCLLWYATDGKVYFDRIYLKQHKHLKEFYAYLSENKITNIYGGNKNYPYSSTDKHITVQLEEFNFEKYPYIDTLCYLDTKEKTLNNFDKGGVEVVHVQYTSGGIGSRTGASSVRSHLYSIDNRSKGISTYCKKASSFAKAVAFIPEDLKIVEATEELVKKHHLVSITAKDTSLSLSTDLLMPKEYLDSLFYKSDYFKDNIKKLINNINSKDLKKEYDNLEDDCYYDYLDEEEFL